MTNQTPSSRKLLLATVGAAFAAVVLLLTIVLPAEYGIDPLGTGRMLGLSKLAEAKAEPATTAEQTVAPVAAADVATAAVPASAAPSTDAIAATRNDRTVLTLQPGQGAEVKATMQNGQQMEFQWQTDGELLYFDFHGDEFNAPQDVFTSYQEGTEAKQQGSFTATFGGKHGWYWKNRSNVSVTVVLTTSGNYEDIYRL